MRDYVSTDEASAAHLAAMDEDFPLERPEPDEYLDLDPAGRAAWARRHQRHLLERAK